MTVDDEEVETLRRKLETTVGRLLDDIDAQIAALHSSQKDISAFLSNEMLELVGDEPQFPRPSSREMIARGYNADDKSVRDRKLFQLAMGRGAAMRVLAWLHEPECHDDREACLTALNDLAAAFSYATRPAIEAHRGRPGKRGKPSTAGKQGGRVKAGQRRNGTDCEQHADWKGVWRENPEWSVERCADQILNDPGLTGRATKLQLTVAQIVRGLRCRQCRPVAPRL